MLVVSLRYYGPKLSQDNTSQKTGFRGWDLTRLLGLRVDRARGWFRALDARTLILLLPNPRTIHLATAWRTPVKEQSFAHPNPLMAETRKIGILGFRVFFKRGLGFGGFGFRVEGLLRCLGIRAQSLQD